MKAAIYVSKKPNDGLKEQMDQAFALIEANGWEMVRLVHQDDLSNDSNLESFFQAIQAGEFQVLMVPSADVFSERVVEALKHYHVTLEVYTPRDPALVERERQAKEAHLKREAQAKERKQAALEKMAGEPWKAKLMEAFLKDQGKR